MEEITESDDDVPLSRPGKRPRMVEVQAGTPDTGPSASAVPVESSWIGYVRPKCGEKRLKAHSLTHPDRDAAMTSCDSWRMFCRATCC